MISWRRLCDDLGVPAEPVANALRALEPDTGPWLVRVMMGLGAWIASCFLLGSIGSCVGLAIDNALFWTVAGVFLLVSATFARRLSAHNGFVEQAALAMVVTGMSAFAGGLNQLLGVDAAAQLGVAVAAGALVLFYNDTFTRAGATVTAISALAAAAGAAGGVDAVAPAGMLLALVALAQTALYARSRWTAALQAPVQWGALLALYGATLLDAVDHTANPFDVRSTTWMLAVGLGGTGALLARTMLLRVFAFVAAIALGALGVPGVLAGAIGILVATWRGDRLLFGVTVAYLVAFSSYYYYSLDLSLWSKAGAMAGSGVLLLALRAFVLVLGRAQAAEAKAA